MAERITAHLSPRQSNSSPRSSIGKKHSISDAFNGGNFPRWRGSVHATGSIGAQLSIAEKIARDAALIEKYRRFSCATMQRQITRRGKSKMEPFCEPVYASVLFADISGFTRLSSRLSAEQLKFHINEYFSLVIQVINENGGDVVKFLGDAVLIVWPVDLDATQDIKATATLMASLCALQLLKDCGQYDRGEDKDAVSLRLHCGVGAGLLHCMCVGEGDRWEYVVSGDPIHQLAKALPEAGTGEVCLSAEAFKLVENKLEGREASDGNRILTGRSAPPIFDGLDSSRDDMTTPDRERLGSIFRRRASLIINVSRLSMSSTKVSDNDNNDSSSSSLIGERRNSKPKLKIESPLLNSESAISALEDYNSTNSTASTSTTMSLSSKTPGIIESASRTSSLHRIILKKDSKQKLESITDCDYDDASVNSPENKGCSNKTLHFSPMKSNPDLDSNKPDNNDNDSNNTNTNNTNTNNTNTNNSNANANNNTNRSSAPTIDIPVMDDSSYRRTPQTRRWSTALYGTEVPLVVMVGSPGLSVSPQINRTSCNITPARDEDKVRGGTLGGSGSASASGGNIGGSGGGGGTSSRNNRPPSTPSSSEQTPGPMSSTKRSMFAWSIGGLLNNTTGTGTGQKDRDVSDITSFNEVDNNGGNGGGDNEESNRLSLKTPGQPIARQLSRRITTAASTRRRSSITDERPDPFTFLANNPLVSEVRSYLHDPLGLMNIPPVTIPTQSQVPSRRPSATGSFLAEFRPSLQMAENAQEGQRRRVSILEMIQMAADAVNDSGASSPGAGQGQGQGQNSNPVRRKSSFLENFGMGPHHRRKSSTTPETPNSLLHQESATSRDLRLFVQEPARPSLEGVSEENMFELRNVTTIFIELLNLSDDFGDGTITRPQQVMRVVLSCLQRFRGSLRQFCVDDKGCVIIIAFGLPGSSHEDNSLRSVESSIAIRRMLEAVKISCRIGIAEGRVYCGLVGSRSRCEYAMMGCSVNLAARLMGKCEPGGILVDESVYKIALSRFVFEPLQPIAVKGYTDPVSIFRPTERAAYNAVLGGNALSELPFIGRKAELDTFMKAIKSSKKTQTSPYKAVISGAPSVGKTRLAVEVIRQVTAKRGNLRNVIGIGSDAHKSNPYHVVRQLLEQLMGLDLRSHLLVEESSEEEFKSASECLESSNGNGIEGGSGTGTGVVGGGGSIVGVGVGVTTSESPVVTALLKWLQEHAADMTLKEHKLPVLIENDEVSQNGTLIERNFKIQAPVTRSIDSSSSSNTNTVSNRSIEDHSLRDLLPLLNPVLGLKLPENVITRNMSESKRKRLVDSLVLKLLLLGHENLFDVVFLDNIQYSDIPSLKILIRFMSGMTKGILIATRRQIDLTVSTSKIGNIFEKLIQNSLLECASSLCINVDLKPFSVAEVKQLMEAVIGPALLNLNPRALCQKNLVGVTDRSRGCPLHAAMLAAGLRNAMNAGRSSDVDDLPAGGNDVIVEKFDELSSDDQVVLKTASVIGMQFTWHELRHTLLELHFDTIVSSLLVSLTNLIESKLIVEHHGNYRFSDRAVQESVYNLMLSSQRSLAHGILGIFLESSDAPPESTFQDIVRHFAASDNMAKKVEYIDKSAILAFQSHSYGEAYRNVGALFALATGSDFDVFLHQGLNSTGSGGGGSGGGSSKKQLSQSRIRTGRFTSCLPWLSLSSSTSSKVYVTDSNGKPLTECADTAPPTLSVQKWLAIEEMFKISNKLIQKRGKGEISMDMLAKWIGMMGLLQFKFGNLRDSNNALLLALSACGISLTSLRRKKFSLMDTFRGGISRPVTPSVPNFETLERLQSYLQYLAWLHLVRGLPDLSLQMFDAAFQLMNSFLSPTSTSTGGGGGNNNSGIGHGKGNGGSSSYRIDPVTLKKVEMLRYRLEAFQTVASIVMHGDVMNKSKMMKTTTSFNLYVEKLHSLQQADDVESVDDVMLSLCFAFHAMAAGDISGAISYFEGAIEQATLQESSEWKYLSLLGKAWLLFLSGNIEESIHSCDAVIEYTSSIQNIALRMWALELDVVTRTILADFTRADESIEKLQGMQHRRKFCATTCAVVAYSYAQRKPSANVYMLAVEACTKLSARKQGTPISCILLSLAVTAAFDVYESWSVPTTRSQRLSFGVDDPKTTTTTTTGAGIGNSAHDTVPHSVMLSKNNLRAVAQGGRGMLLDAAKKGVESLDEHTQRYPILTPLNDALNTRLKRIRAEQQPATQEIDGLEHVAHLKELHSQIKGYEVKFKQFVFAHAYLHQQRYMLYNQLLPRHREAHVFETEEARELAIEHFRNLGVPVPELMVVKKGEGNFEELTKRQQSFIKDGNHGSKSIHRRTSSTIVTRK